jgi:pyridoxine 5-phosphate synthase
MSLPKLGVNIDHVATVRQARLTFEPDPVAAAALATLGGAEIITVHLREDRRHIQDRDLRLLKETVFSKLNLEMACAKEIVGIACRTRPEQVTLVPERRAEVTTEGGLDVLRGGRRLSDVVRSLKRKGIIVSFFVDADPAQLRASADIGADTVELHTGPYANARSERDVRRRLDALIRAAELARELGLRLNAGHGLTYTNLRALIEAITVEELHIGHSIVSRALLVGMERAVRDMCALIARHAVQTPP